MTFKPTIHKNTESFCKMKEWKQNFLAKQDSVLVVTVILNHNSLSVGCDLKQSQIFLTIGWHW